MKTTPTIKLFTASVIIVLSGWMSMSFINYQKDDKPKPWKVSDADKSKKNPIKADKESIAAGKVLFTKHCKSCHGAGGLGDGPKSKELDTPCGDFVTKEFKAQSDGEIFYKTKEGRDDMPTFKKKIPEDEDIWAVINYVRTLGEAK